MMKNALGEVIVDHAVCTLIGLGFTGDFEGFQVENDHLALRPIADKAPFDGPLHVA
jgi:hypothetical protein